MLVLLLLIPAAGVAQVITNTSNGTLSTSIPFGNLTPGTSSNVSTVQIQFRVRDKDVSGYHLEASATFTATPTSLTDGGSTIAASDIGIGITTLTLGGAVITPRTDTIHSGFDYNPGSTSVTNGLPPFTGMSNGKATLADIVNNPGITILSGPRIATDEDSSSSTNPITVTLTFGLLGQFSTPATFSGTITLTLKNGL